MTDKIPAHTHIYVARKNSFGEDGYNCTVCGFRIQSATDILAAKNGGAMFPEVVHEERAMRSARMRALVYAAHCPECDTPYETEDNGTMLTLSDMKYRDTFTCVKCGQVCRIPWFAEVPA